MDALTLGLVTNMTTTTRTFRVVSRGENGELRIRSYPSETQLSRLHDQIGIDDCSTHLSLRGLPVFRGLIGPMVDEGDVVRYESPEVFESLTKEWVTNTAHGRPRRRRTREES